MNQARHEGTSHVRELEDEHWCESDLVIRYAPNPLYWPELDVDLSVESIEHPESFPLSSGNGA